MSPDAIQPIPRSLILPTQDGFPISATLYPGQLPLKGHLVVAGATGVPQGFYRRFAEYASAQGFAVLTLDYRGIGKSAPDSLRSFRMHLLDWARQDLAAAVEYMRDPHIPLFLMGHSLGGHAFGLLPNHRAVDKFFVCGATSGWHGWMPKAESIRVRLMWHGILPVLHQLLGYSPWKLFGAGEDLPLDALRQWRYWAGFPRYFFDDPAMAGIEANFERVTTPIVAANALDDLWAQPAARDAFMQGYCNAPLTRLDLNPADFGGRLGHMGYFRPQARALWDQAFNWFTSDTQAPAPHIPYNQHHSHDRLLV
ncbi:alpha/beta fold hydrolase [Burkholderiaceae bacterium DAT-1]|nr:alpha/beta fold hydrolase [Burkholderiaceae bacterium DAT-1]